MTNELEALIRQIVSEIEGARGILHITLRLIHHLHLIEQPL